MRAAIVTKRPLLTIFTSVWKKPRSKIYHRNIPIAQICSLVSMTDRKISSDFTVLQGEEKSYTSGHLLTFEALDRSRRKGLSGSWRMIIR